MTNATGQTASPGQVADWAKRVMQLAAELERQSWNGDRGGPARFETCLALAEAYIALDRVVVREPVQVRPVRGAEGDEEYRRALESFALEESRKRAGGA